MQTKANGLDLHLGRILDSVIHFRNQVRHSALNPSGEDINTQVGTQQNSNHTYEGVSKSFWTESITNMLTTINMH